jgi:hypothetical protein
MAGMNLYKLKIGTVLTLRKGEAGAVCVDIECPIRAGHIIKVLKVIRRYATYALCEYVDVNGHIRYRHCYIPYLTRNYAEV